VHNSSSHKFVFVIQPIPNWRQVEGNDDNGIQHQHSKQEQNIHEIKRSEHNQCTEIKSLQTVTTLAVLD